MTPTPPGVFTRWASSLLAVGIFSVPLVFALNLNDTFDLPKMTGVYLLAIALALLWGWQRLSPGIVRYDSRVLLPLVAFLLCTAASAVFSIEPRLSVAGAYRIYVFGFFPLVAFGALLWLSLQIDGPERSRRIAQAAFWAGACVGVYAFLQYTGHEPFESMPLVVQGRPWASLGNPLYLGAVAMMALPIAQAFWMNVEFPRPVLALATLFIMAGLGLSLSRSAWTGALVGSLVTGSLVWKHRSIVESRRVLPFAALVIVGVLIGLSTSQMRERASVLFSLHEQSNSARLEGWKAGLRVWAHHPVLGTGADTFNRSFREFRSLAYVHAAGSDITQADAHNDFVQIAATEGLLGLSAMLFGVIVGVALVIRSWRSKNTISPLHAGLVGSVVSLLVQDQFNFSSVSTSLWAAVFIGLLAPRRAREMTTPVSSPVGLRVAFVLVGLIAVVAAARPLVADGYYRRGLALAQSGRFLAASDAYERAARLEPNISEYQTQRANLDRDLGQLSQGDSRQAWFSAAWVIAQDETRRHPHDPDSWNNLGVSAMWMSQLAGIDHRQDAYDAFQKAVALDPVFMDAWANLARWQHLAGRLDLENQLWEKVLLIDPTHAFARQVLHRP